MKPSSRSLADLAPEFRAKAEELLVKCQERGVDLLVTCTYRSLEEQAHLYCQGRTAAEINFSIALLPMDCSGILKREFDKNPYDRHGKHVTNAAPGASWHNYAEAMDCVPIVCGKPQWSTSAGGWQIYGEGAVKLGLTWAGNWTRFKEYPHVQLRPDGNPSLVYSPEEAIAQLKRIGAL